jgi:para-aminobenzoate synthetase component 1
MQSIHSQTLPFAEFCGLVEYLVRSDRADLFLSGPGFPGEHMNYIGLDIDDELTITGEMSREEISRFVFSTEKPVLGFLNYPLGFAYHDLISSKSSLFPAGIIRKYKYYLIYDSQAQYLEILASDAIRSSPDELLRNFHQSGTDAVAPTTPIEERIRQSLSRDEYIRRVGETLGYIRDGYIYQLNLSIKYTVTAPDFDTAGLFLYLWKAYPAPFYVWFRLGRYQLLSTSPERFLRADGGQVRSEPIKGTLAFESLSPDLKRYLKESPKESAELSMIVDMIRNDISINCEYGSVGVRNHKSIFAVDNLLQMYSTVTGALREGKTCLDLLLDAFPGGSITGCPKRKAIEIIDRLEPHVRDSYCGSFFRIDDENTMDSSITIRTGYYDKKAGELSFFAGSGIVADSNPEGEYEETAAKAGKFLKALGLECSRNVP